VRSVDDPWTKLALVSRLSTLRHLDCEHVRRHAEHDSAALESPGRRRVESGRGAIWRRRTIVLIGRRVGRSVNGAYHARLRICRLADDPRPQRLGPDSTLHDIPKPMEDHTAPFVFLLISACTFQRPALPAPAGNRDERWHDSSAVHRSGKGDTGDARRWPLGCIAAVPPYAFYATCRRSAWENKPRGLRAL
jgi:hypothetical protein